MSYGWEPGNMQEIPVEVVEDPFPARSGAAPAAASERRPVSWRELLAIVGWVALCDATIYRGHGFAGYALLFCGAPVLLGLGAAVPRLGLRLGVVGLMLLALAARLVWCGDGLQIAAGWALLVAWAMCLAGLCPHVLETILFATQTIPAGCAGLIHYARSLNQLSLRVPRVAWLNVILPLGTFLLFSLLFILANPDLLTAFGEHLGRFLDDLRDWILNFAPRPLEMVFWAAVAWLAVGLLRPLLGPALLEETPRESDMPGAKPVPAEPAFFYAAFRNTLVTVIALFAVYLAFEFKTLWFRVFPKGFYYSGYAHQGAAWLTVALALATLILSFVFRGRILRDPRLPKLRRLAWIWSAENFLLAVAVYHRLYIYVGFNGMTRMRTVGLFGISTVVAGFILVLWKIARRRDFIWLVRRQLWALAIAAYLFALTPVDTLVHTYNVRRILAGDPAPSVQISVHPISPEGFLVLLPLLECQDDYIREGVRAMLSWRHEEAEAIAQRGVQQGWTTFQASESLLLERLRTARGAWSAYADHRQRDAARKRFDDYAYQWY